VDKLNDQQLSGSIQVSRRSFLLASAGLILPQFAWSESTWKAIRYWKLNDRGDTAKESLSGTDAPIASRTGHPIWVGEGTNRALRLDGYSVWLNQQNVRLPMTGHGMTLSAWIALESYPVNNAALISLRGQPDASLSFAVDPWGCLHATRRVSVNFASCESPRPISKLSWHHVAAVFSASEITLYIDGVQSGQSSYGPTFSIDTESADVSIGRSPDCEIIAGVFPTGALNGLLKEVRVFNAPPKDPPNSLRLYGVM
jgi:hypothetical protein